MVNDPFIDVGWGSQTNVYLPFVSVILNVFDPVAATLVFTFTPGPFKWKLWMLDLVAHHERVLARLRRLLSC